MQALEWIGGNIGSKKTNRDEETKLVDSLSSTNQLPSLNPSNDSIFSHDIKFRRQPRNPYVPILQTGHGILSSALERVGSCKYPQVQPRVSTELMRSREVDTEPTNSGEQTPTFSI